MSSTKKFAAVLAASVACVAMTSGTAHAQGNNPNPLPELPASSMGVGENPVAGALMFASLAPLGGSFVIGCSLQLLDECTF